MSIYFPGFSVVDAAALAIATVLVVGAALFRIGWLPLERLFRRPRSE